MDKTLVVQLSLMAVALWGIWNVIRTERAGQGLLSMLRPVSCGFSATQMYHTAVNISAASIMPTKYPTITLPVIIGSKPRRREFKYYTLSNGNWLEKICEGDRNEKT